ncbi:MAG: hypothetical protein KKF62_06460 [Bacteroidetes bacterium]|nr:hypothetical protein [Bacteroidota bacterium]MBU1115435.1 hypothetical protein [Bacteroidota bacterium]MBU1797578.1 hypothetical protein [Bacteroidota bacterium]
MKYFLLSVILFLGVFFQACKEDANRQWVTIDPIQCMGNTWEQDWLEKNNDDYELYSKFTDTKKLQIFEQYFENLGILIYKLEQSFPYDATCAACNCPRGDRIHCYISENDIDQMLSFGFRIQ